VIASATTVRGWLRVARASGIGPQRWSCLVRACGAELLADPSRAQLAAIGLSEEEIARLINPVLERALDEEQAQVERSGWVQLCPTDERYPPLLSLVAVPPPILTVWGNAAALRLAALGVVGSRRADSYGLHTVRLMVDPLARRGVAIVSGLARGIDTAAHQLTVDAGGTTIAVLGSGLAEVYPTENLKLAQRITEQGALITEFPPTMPPLADNFPRRNRIISGIAHAVLIVQASRHSGALYTANFAAEEGRSVLVVPGRVADPLAAGNLALLRDGGIMVRDANDILEEVPALQAALQSVLNAEPLDAIAPKPLPPSTSAMARAVYRSIPLQDEIAVDELLADVGLPADQVLAGLFELELIGMVEQQPGSRFRRALGG
jgi:DNA processing protein